MTSCFFFEVTICSKRKLSMHSLSLHVNFDINIFTRFSGTVHIDILRNIYVHFILLKLLPIYNTVENQPPSFCLVQSLTYCIIFYTTVYMYNFLNVLCDISYCFLPYLLMSSVQIISQVYSCINIRFLPRLDHQYV